jgi:hypothetical protein
MMRASISNEGKLCLVLDGTDEILMGPIAFGQFLVIQDLLHQKKPTINFRLANFPPTGPPLDPGLEPASASAPANLVESVEPPPRDPGVSPYDLSLRHCESFCPDFSILLEHVAFQEPSNEPFVLEFTARIGLDAVGDVGPIRVEGVDTSRQRLFGRKIIVSRDVLGLPRYATLVVRFGRPTPEGKVVFSAAAAVGVFDRYGRLASGRRFLGLIPGITIVPPHPTDDPRADVVVVFRWPTFFAPVFYRMWHVEDKSVELKRRSSTVIHKIEMAPIVFSSPLHELTDEEKRVLREVPVCTPFPALLPWYLRTLDLTRVNDVVALPHILRQWKPPKVENVLAILNPKFLEPEIRKFAIAQMLDWSDSSIQLYLLQLMKAMQYEQEIDSPLCLFLLRRAFEEPKYLGLKFFWALRSIAHLPWMRSRVFALSYLFCAFSQPHDRARYLESLRITRAQIELWSAFHPAPGVALPAVSIADAIRSRVKLSPGFHLPIDPKILVSGYVSKKCRFMDSKKKPRTGALGVRKKGG